MPVSTRSQKMQKRVSEECSIIDEERSTVEEYNDLCEKLGKKIDVEKDADDERFIRWFIKESNAMVLNINKINEMKGSIHLYSIDDTAHLPSVKVLKSIRYLVYDRMTEFYNFINKHLEKFIQIIPQNSSKCVELYNTLYMKISEIINGLFKNEFGEDNVFIKSLGKQTKEELDVISNLVNAVMECDRILYAEQVEITVSVEPFSDALYELKRLVECR
jgi:hypothetical protein